MLPGGEAFDAIVAAFGAAVLNAAGEIDRKRLAERGVRFAATVSLN